MRVKYEWLIYSIERRLGKKIEVKERIVTSFHDEEEIKSYINAKNKELAEKGQKKRLFYKIQFFFIGPREKKYLIDARPEE